jgi:hypothetical protein
MKLSTWNSDTWDVLWLSFISVIVVTVCIVAFGGDEEPLTEPVDPPHYSKGDKAELVAGGMAVILSDRHSSWFHGGSLGYTVTIRTYTGMESYWAYEHELVVPEGHVAEVIQ